MTDGVLASEVAIVTGGGRGLGQGTARALASAGASVVVTGRTQSVLDETAELIAERGAASLAVRCDVTEPAEIEALVAATVERFGTIDILVNNAQGPHGNGRLLDVEDTMFEVGFKSGPLATYRLMRACHPHLTGGGVIVNLGTGAALRADPVGYGFYAAVKEATRTLTRVAAVEWAADGIRVHAIVPLADSDTLQAWAAARPAESAAFMATVPLGRPGDPEADIGRAVVFLCGPDSGYMTGNTVLIDGGQGYLR